MLFSFCSIFAFFSISFCCVFFVTILNYLHQQNEICDQLNGIFEESAERRAASLATLQNEIDQIDLAERLLRSVRYTLDFPISILQNISNIFI